MRVQVKVIRFTLLMSIFFAVITYLVTLNIEVDSVRRGLCQYAGCADR